MKSDSCNQADQINTRYQGTWGVWLFRIALLASFAFFWWLAIYSHGVTGHH